MKAHLVGFAVSLALVMGAERPLRATWAPAALVFGVTTFERVVVPQATTFNDLSPFSVVQWLYPTSFATTFRRTFQNDPDRKHLLVEQTTGALTGFVDRATTNCTFTTSTALKLNIWNAVVFTYDDTNACRVFLSSDGAAPREAAYASRTAGSGSIVAETPSPVSFVILNANLSSYARSFEGDSNYFALVPASMTEGDIAVWYATGKLPALPRIYFPNLGAHGGVTAVDVSGYGNHGTVTAAVPRVRPLVLPWRVLTRRNP